MRIVNFRGLNLSNFRNQGDFTRKITRDDKQNRIQKRVKEFRKSKMKNKVVSKNSKN